jgi:PAS domain S-box-containing protein
MTDRDAVDSVSSELFEEAIEHTDDAVYITDAEGHIEYVNSAFEEITGYERAEAIGKTPRILKSGENDDAYYEDLWDTILSNQRWETEVVDETKDGEQIVFDQTISPITTADGEVEKFVAVARDITERKERERELELLKQIQSRALRHNLRNKLQIIKSQAERCATNHDGCTQESEIIFSATDELETLVEKTQTIESFLGRELSTTQISLCDELGTLVERHRDQFPTVSFNFDCSVGSEIESLPEVLLAFDNLIENAAGHNDSKNPVVDVTVSVDEGGTVVAVSDNGSGIPEQELVPLVKREETALTHGTGIGLWLVSWVIDKTEASLTHETGRTGTTFTVQFPQTP